MNEKRREREREMRRFLTRKKECSGAWRRERAGLGGEVGKRRKRRAEEKDEVREKERKRESEHVLSLLLFRLRIRAIVRACARVLVENRCVTGRL